MFSKTFIIAAMIAYVEARFGQEQVPIAAISSVQGGASGAASTIAGAAISDLLGAANSCAKLTTADKIFTELGGGADALAAAIGMVTAEKNTNPFANGNVQNVCGDASLPVTPELRGITPLIDPAVDVNGAVAALSKSSAASPLAADGMSIFDLLDKAGLGGLVVAQSGAGGAAAGGAAKGGNNNAGGAAQGGNNNAGGAAAGSAAKGGNNNAGGAAQGGNNNAGGAAAGSAAQSGNNNACDAGGNAGNNAGNAGGNAGNNNAGNGNANAGNGNNNSGNTTASAGGNAAAGGNTAAGGNAAAGGAADFGKCTPTITFQGGEGNRPATEFTFQIADPVARGSQGEALNPDIITNALCNNLTNFCAANAAAVALCQTAKAQVKGGARDKSTADAFNAAMGFAGAVTNPAGGAADVAAAGAAKAARKMRRGLRVL
ncbi:hypothetical protein EJ02DRAFT_462980 [Clathrospora elynae]|uniref:Circumsporozoite protein n=1 Tax=Clathrospora elynae TaxID=706981 RepID=A0A6A5TAV9_9PLEO|nr:hypothetical protein EJ02DRAFT_462980 [Clathrospora elynae]